MMTGNAFSKALVGLSQAKRHVHTIKDLIQNLVIEPFSVLQKLASLDNTFDVSTLMPDFDTLDIFASELNSVLDLTSKDKDLLDEIEGKMGLELNLKILEVHTAFGAVVSLLSHCVPQQSNNYVKQIHDFFVNSSLVVDNHLSVARVVGMLKALLNVLTFQLTKHKNVFAESTLTIDIVVDNIDLLTGLMQNYRDHKRLFTLAHEQLLTPIFSSFEVIAHASTRVAAVNKSIKGSLLQHIRESLTKLLRLVLLTDHHHLDKFMLAIGIDKAGKSKQSAITDIAIDYAAESLYEDELKSLSSSLVFTNTAADSKKAYHMLLFDACLTFLQATPSASGVEGIAAVCELFMDQSRLDVGSSPDEEATKKHVSRCVTLVAAMLQGAFHHSSAVEAAKRPLWDEVVTALQAKLLATLHRSIDRIPQHITMLKFTNYLFHLLKHSLLLAHQYATTQPKSLVVVHALDCIRCVSNIDYKTLMQDNTLVAVLRLLDVSSDADAASAVKLRVLHDIWATYSDIRNIDTLIKALLAVSEADSVYSRDRSSTGSIRRILSHPVMASKMRTTFSTLPMGSYRIVYKVLFSDIGSSVQRSRDARYLQVAMMLSCHRQVLSTSLVEMDKLHLYMVSALQTIVKDFQSATHNKVLLVSVVKEILQYIVKFFSYNMHLLFQSAGGKDVDTVDSLLVGSLVDSLRGDSTSSVEVLELLVYLVMYVLNAYTKTSRDKDLRSSSCIMSCLQLVEQQVLSFTQQANMRIIEQVVRLVMSHIEVFKYIYRWGSEQLQSGVKALVAALVKNLVCASEERSESATDFSDLLHTSVSVDSQVLHELFRHGVRQLVSEISAERNDALSRMYASMMLLFPVEFLSSVAKDTSVFRDVVLHVEDMLLSPAASLAPVLRLLSILVSGFVASSSHQHRLSVPLLGEFTVLCRLLSLAPTSRTLDATEICLVGDLVVAVDACVLKQMGALARRQLLPARYLGRYLAAWLQGEEELARLLCADPATPAAADLLLLSRRVNRGRQRALGRMLDGLAGERRSRGKGGAAVRRAVRQLYARHLRNLASLEAQGEHVQGLAAPAFHLLGKIVQKPESWLAEESGTAARGLGELMLLEAQGRADKGAAAGVWSLLPALLKQGLGQTDEGRGFLLDLLFPMLLEDIARSEKSSEEVQDFFAALHLAATEGLGTGDAGCVFLLTLHQQLLLRYLQRGGNNGTKKAVGKAEGAERELLQRLHALCLSCLSQTLLSPLPMLAALSRWREAHIFVLTALDSSGSSASVPRARLLGLARVFSTLTPPLLLAALPLLPRTQSWEAAAQAMLVLHTYCAGVGKGLLPTRCLPQLLTPLFTALLQEALGAVRALYRSSGAGAEGATRRCLQLLVRGWTALLPPLPAPALPSLLLALTSLVFRAMGEEGGEQGDHQQGRGGADAGDSRKKRARREEVIGRGNPDKEKIACLPFSALVRDEVSPAFFPLLEKVPTKDKDIVFLQLDSQPRQLLQTVQELYVRTFKYKGY